MGSLVAWWAKRFFFLSQFSARIIRPGRPVGPTSSQSCWMPHFFALAGYLLFFLCSSLAGYYGRHHRKIKKHTSFAEHQRTSLTLSLIFPCIFFGWAGESLISYDFAQNIIAASWSQINHCSAPPFGTSSVEKSSNVWSHNSFQHQRSKLFYTGIEITSSLFSAVNTLVLALLVLLPLFINTCENSPQNR